MLSYQHAYHAGNLADLHKHALLAVALDYLTRKDKPLSYLETHAGRGLYRLDGAEAAKTQAMLAATAPHSAGKKKASLTAAGTSSGPASSITPFWAPWHRSGAVTASRPIRARR